MVVRSSGAGSVVAHNYMDDGFISWQENWQEIGLNGSHMVGSHHMLFEPQLWIRGEGIPKDAGIDSIGLPKLIVKAAFGGPPQWPSISRRSIAVSMTSAKCSKTGKRTG